MVFCTHSVYLFRAMPYVMLSTKIKQQDILSDLRKGTNMSAFDKVIGYEEVKDELRIICDMIRNPERYTALGATMPRGVILYGEPGVGKTLMARAFAEESGRNTYILRRSKPDGSFITEMNDIFSQAAENTPSVIILDDMDKYKTDKNSNEEFTALQACIDNAQSVDVFVIATANGMFIPESLLRAGRFDHKIEMNAPRDETAIAIISHYMNAKSFVEDINIDDIAKMLYGSSCAELESLLNTAARYAGFERADKINMRHILRAHLLEEFGREKSPATEKERMRVAYHEAGHLAVSEAIKSGSIGFAAICPESVTGSKGVVVRCADHDQLSDYVLVFLAGRAAEEMVFGSADAGSDIDIKKAIHSIKAMIISGNACGLNWSVNEKINSEDLKGSQETACRVLLEQYMRRARTILTQNRTLLDAVASALAEKGVLLNSDIRKFIEQHPTVSAGELDPV